MVDLTLKLVRTNNVRQLSQMTGEPGMQDSKWWICATYEMIGGTRVIPEGSGKAQLLCSLPGLFLLINNIL